MGDRHKIAFIISSLNMGGAQRAVSNIVMTLSDDWDIRLILNTDENIVYPYKGEIVSLGIHGGGDRNGLIYQIRVWFKRYRYVKTMKKNEDFDAVVSFLDSANILNLSTGKSGKNIVSVRNCISQNKTWKYKYIVGPLIRAKYNKADCIVAVSESVKQDLIKNYGIESNKIVTIYNCCDVDDIYEKSRKKASFTPNSQNINIITAGRLCHQKGQWHLIRAMKNVVNVHPEVQLYIFGEGGLKDYLNDLIREMNLESNVKLCDFAKDLYEIMGKMDIFVLPSLFEGLGNVFLEALSCGLPCISADYEGASEVLKDDFDLNAHCSDVEYADYGLLVPMMSAEHKNANDELEREEIILAKAITALAEDESLRRHYSEKALERAHFFSPDSIVSEWEKIMLS